MKAPVTRHNKPRSVMVAVWLIYSAIFLAGVFLVFDIFINAAYGYGIVPIEFLPALLLTVIFLITPSANAWFKRENIKTTEPHNSKPI